MVKLLSAGCVNTGCMLNADYSPIVQLDQVLLWVPKIGGEEEGREGGDGL